MNLVKDDVAHDGHPDKGGEEEEDVEVADQNTGRIVGLLDLWVSLDDDKEEEGKQKRQRKVHHHLVVIRPRYKCQAHGPGPHQVNFCIILKANLVPSSCRAHELE